MAERGDFAARGEVELPDGPTACDATVTAEGLSTRADEQQLLAWPGHEIAAIERSDYEIAVTNVFDEQRIVLRRFARRTDELEIALRRARADALARLMAPPGKAPMDVFEAAGERPGLLFRYDDGLRWIPHSGDCCARLYSEIGEATFDDQSWELVLSGPFGETRIGGLRRLTRELVAEITRHAREANEQFAEALDAAGLPWRAEAIAGRMAAHVPFEAPQERIGALAESGIICPERREYWDLMVEAGIVERLVLSPGGEGLRGVALCRVPGGDLYETLSEANHASFVFADADEVVRAWTEVGFRREPIFSPAERDPAAALAAVLPSLRAARSGLRQRIIHDEPGLWRGRLLK